MGLELPNDLRKPWLECVIQDDSSFWQATVPCEHESVALDQLECGSQCGIDQIHPRSQAIGGYLAVELMTRRMEVEVSRQGRQPDRLPRVQPMTACPVDRLCWLETDVRKVGQIVLAVFVQAK